MAAIQGHPGAAQYHQNNTGPWTQDPYDKAFLPDAIRQVFGVPTQEEQAKKAPEMNQ